MSSAATPGLPFGLHGLALPARIAARLAAVALGVIALSAAAVGLLCAASARHTLGLAFAQRTLGLAGMHKVLLANMRLALAPLAGAVNVTVMPLSVDCVLFCTYMGKAEVAPGA